MALGVYPDVPLKEARQRRDQARELLARGQDPGEVKKEAKAAARAEELEAENTFKAVATDWLTV